MLSRLCLVVLVAGALSSIACRYVAVDADLGSEVVVGSYGVKLCGREFIRAVIFTCGGSRWKRSLGDEFDPFQVSSDADANEGDNQQHAWQRGLASDAVHSPIRASLSPRSLADLVSLLAGAAGEAGGDPAGGSSPPEEMERRPKWLRQNPYLADSASSSSTVDKRKRDFNAGVAGMCCSQGCTKSDIGYLC